MCRTICRDTWCISRNYHNRLWARPSIQCSVGRDRSRLTAFLSAVSILDVLILSNRCTTYYEERVWKVFATEWPVNVCVYILQVHDIRVWYVFSLSLHPICVVAETSEYEWHWLAGLLYMTCGCFSYTAKIHSTTHSTVYINTISIGYNIDQVTSY